MSMIDQLVYTWSAKGLHGQRGEGVRAASPGLKDEDSPRYQSLAWSLSYNLPSGLDPGTVTSKDAPVCLALVNTSYEISYKVGSKIVSETVSERILLRKQLGGVDAVGRSGVPLTHLLAGPPADLSVKKAILLWYACEPDIWVTDRNTTRPGMLEQIRSERLDKLAQQGWNKFTLTKGREFALREVLLHFLQNSPPTRIYLSGDSASIATVIWGVTQSLPGPMLADLTFSTYEYNIKESQETIVGLSPYQDIPALARGEVYIDLNSGSGSSRLMPTREMKEYINFAIAQLLNRMNLDPDSGDDLDAIITFAEEENVTKPALLLKFFQESFAPKPLPPLVETLPTPVGLSPTDPVQVEDKVPTLPPSEGHNAPSGVPRKPSDIPALRMFQQFQDQLAQASHLPLLQRGTRLSLLFNVLLFLCLIGSLIYIPLGQSSSRQNATMSTLAQVAQNEQQTSTALNSLPGSQPQLQLLLGAYVSVNPVPNNSDLKVYVVVQNISQSTWSGQKGFYLACVQQSDPDCQAIINNKNNTIHNFTVDNPPVPMQGIAMQHDVSVPPQGYYVFVFSLTAQLTPNAQGDSEDHHIDVQLFYSGQAITTANTTFSINFTVKKV